jgi:uncharacterized membrane protein YphA (DoxX/SURF4 family)
VALVALRLGIGWHFFQEGASKLRDGNFNSAGFLGSAKGPLAPLYHSAIWDADGYYRLDSASTLDAWKAFADNAGVHYGFDDSQVKKADQKYREFEKQFKYFLAANAEDIREYFLGLERRDRYRGNPHQTEGKETPFTDRAWTEVPSLRGQLGKLEDDLKKKRDGWLRTIDGMWADYEREINAIATSDQASAGYLKLPRVGRFFGDSETVNKIIPWFDFTIGVLLILGLFTRFAAVVGAGFLLTVVLSQWPYAPGANATYYQTIEMLGLLVLAGTGAGRFAGLDFFIHAAKMKCCPPKQES